MCEDVIKKIISKNLTIVTAESITGGLISKLVTDVSGSSSVLKESFVVYSNEAKVSILGVDENLIKDFGVVSKEVAKDMSEKLKKMTGREICISTTGNAGPTVCDDKPVGRVYIGIYYLSDLYVYEKDFEGSRDEIRLQTAKFVFDTLDELIK